MAATPSDRNYRKALKLIGSYWSAGGRVRMTPAVAQAYRLVGRYAHAHYAPRAGVPHPGKSAAVRLRRHFRPSPALTRDMKIVTRIVRTAGGRTWTQVWLEIVDRDRGCVQRLRQGLRRPAISVRGLRPGRCSGPRSFQPCGWRALTPQELAHLPPQAVQFLSATGRPTDSADDGA